MFDFASIANIGERMQSFIAAVEKRVDEFSASLENLGGKIDHLIDRVEAVEKIMKGEHDDAA